MTAGIIVHEVVSMRDVNPKAPKHARAGYEHNGDIYIVRGLHPIVREYALWHEWCHYRICKLYCHERSEAKAHNAFELVCAVIQPLMLALIWYERQRHPKVNVWVRTR